MKVTICDKCGKIIKDNLYYKIIPKKVLANYNENSIDLCYCCYDKFLDFLEGSEDFNG